MRQIIRKTNIKDVYWIYDEILNDKFIVINFIQSLYIESTKKEVDKLVYPIPINLQTQSRLEEVLMRNIEYQLNQEGNFIDIEFIPNIINKFRT